MAIGRYMLPVNGRPSVYDLFLLNTKAQHNHDRIIPFPVSSTVGMSVRSFSTALQLVTTVLPLSCAPALSPLSLGCEDQRVPLVAGAGSGSIACVSRLRTRTRRVVLRNVFVLVRVGPRRTALWRRLGLGGSLCRCHSLFRARSCPRSPHRTFTPPLLSDGFTDPLY
jgi:hypothetical protein